MMEVAMASTPTNDHLLYRVIGTRIRRARKAKGLSQARLAETVQVQPETMSRYETGAIPLSLSKLFEIAAALDVGVEVLLDVPRTRRSTEEERRETEMVDLWRLLDDEGQDAIINLLRWMSR